MKVDPARARSRRLLYLSLQPTREGQASHAHVLEIITGLRRRGWSIRLVEPPAPTLGRLDALRRLLGIVEAHAQLIVSILRDRPDAVYIRSHFAALPASLVLRLVGVRTVQELNGPIDDAYDAWPWLRRFRRLVRFSVASQLIWAQEVIAVTPELAEYVSRLGRVSDEAVVIGNGADPDRFHPQAVGRVMCDGPYAVFVGALARWQGIGVLIDATRCDEWPSGVKLVVAGDGVDRRLVSAAVRQGSVVWLPNGPYGDVPGLIAHARVAVVPQLATARSNIGLSPLKLFEAMACAMPVVVTDVPGLADPVRATNCGLVVAPNDPHALAHAVREIATRPTDSMAMGERGRQAVMDRYSWDARAGATHAVLLRAIAGSGRNRVYP